MEQLTDVQQAARDYSDKVSLNGILRSSREAIENAFLAGAEWANAPHFVPQKDFPIFPRQFNPFDKVVVRRGNEEWTAALFGRYDSDRTETIGRYVTAGGDAHWHECLLFNDETKKLLGTRNDYPYLETLGGTEDEEEEGEE